MSAPVKLTAAQRRVAERRCSTSGFRLLVLECSFTGRQETVHVCGVHAGAMFANVKVVSAHIGDPDDDCAFDAGRAALAASKDGAK